MGRGMETRMDTRGKGEVATAFFFFYTPLFP